MGASLCVVGKCDWWTSKFVELARCTRRNHILYFKALLVLKDSESNLLLPLLLLLLPPYATGKLRYSGWLKEMSLGAPLPMKMAKKFLIAGGLCWEIALRENREKKRRATQTKGPQSLVAIVASVILVGVWVWLEVPKVLLVIDRSRLGRLDLVGIVVGVGGGRHQQGVGDSAPEPVDSGASSSTKGAGAPNVHVRGRVSGGGNLAASSSVSAVGVDSRESGLKFLFS